MQPLRSVPMTVRPWTLRLPPSAARHPVMFSKTYRNNGMALYVSSLTGVSDAEVQHPEWRTHLCHWVFWGYSRQLASYDLMNRFSSGPRNPHLLLPVILS